MTDTALDIRLASQQIQALHINTLCEELRQLEKRAEIPAESFGNVIRAAFAHSDTMQQKLADEVGVSRGTVARWGAGKTSPHPVMRTVVVKILLLRLFETETGNPTNSP